MHALLTAHINLSSSNLDFWKFLKLKNSNQKVITEATLRKSLVREIAKKKTNKVFLAFKRYPVKT